MVVLGGFICFSPNGQTHTDSESISFLGVKELNRYKEKIIKEKKQKREGGNENNSKI